MKTMRIEFYEKFIDMTEDEIESAHNLKTSLKWAYRLIYPRLEDIDHPREIPGRKNHCEILFYDGTTILVKGSYQDIALQIDLREAQAKEKDFQDEIDE
jgi:hypothetical protein